MTNQLEALGQRHLEEINSKSEFKKRLAVFPDRTVTKPGFLYWVRADEAKNQPKQVDMDLKSEAIHQRFHVFAPGEYYDSDDSPLIEYWDLDDGVRHPNQLNQSFYGLKVFSSDTGIVSDSSYQVETYDYSTGQLPHPPGPEKTIPVYGISYVEGSVDPIKLWRLQALAEKTPYFSKPDALTETYLLRLLLEGKNRKSMFWDGYGSTQIHVKTKYDGVQAVWESWANLLEEMRQRIGQENVAAVRESLPEPEQLKKTVVDLIRAGFPIDTTSLRQEIKKGRVELDPLYYILIKNATPLLKKPFLDRELKIKK
ncbi:hypothetical protein M1328_02120 [Patescibacteria group bacterium]|nr:hypothetical protein [Patescibacteria group bacterium]